MRKLKLRLCKLFYFKQYTLGENSLLTCSLAIRPECQHLGYSQISFYIQSLFLYLKIKTTGRRLKSSLSQGNRRKRHLWNWERTVSWFMFCDLAY